MAESHESKTVVLVAVDASKQAVDSLNYYFDNAYHHSHKVILLHVIELPDMSHAKSGIGRDTMKTFRQANLTPSALYDMWMKENAKSKELEATYSEIVKQKGIKHVSFKTTNGLKPGEVIVEVAGEEKATMIVMGTRGMGLLRRTILGSASDYVVHHAPCAVLVCRKSEDHAKDHHHGKDHKSPPTESKSANTPC